MDPPVRALPWGMHSLLPATPGRHFPGWRLRSLLMASTARSEFITRADLSQTASSAPLVQRGSMALPHPCSPNPPPSVPLAGASTRQEPPFPVQSFRTDMGPRQDALGGVKIPTLSPEAEIMSRKCFCVVSASFLLALLFLSTEVSLCEQFQSQKNIHWYRLNVFAMSETSDL